SPTTLAICRSRWITVAHARTTAYVRERAMRGGTSSGTWRVAGAACGVGAVAHLAAGGTALAGDLGDYEGGGPHHGVGAREVRGVVAADRPAPRAHGAPCEHCGGRGGAQSCWECP